MKIYTYGEDARLHHCQSYLESRDIPYAVNEIILLPIPTKRTENTPYGEKIKRLGDGDLAVCYGTDALADVDPERLLDLSRDEDFLSENAYLTALATVGILLTEEGRALCDLKCGIIGYGRIGRALTNLITFIGSAPRVFTSREHVVQGLCALGVSARLMGDEEDMFADLDVVINTSPTPIPKAPLLAAGGRAKLMELASGVNFPEGISYRPLPALPGKFYPESAGMAIGKAIERHLDRRGRSKV